MTALRCKPGDLAVVVGPGVETPGLLGRFVVVERQDHPGMEFMPGKVASAIDDRTAWICRSATDGELLPAMRDDGEVHQLPHRPIADSILRPIRPNDGEDESLSWARPRVEELE